MKKYFAIFMTLILTFLVGCSSNKDKTLSDYNLEGFTEKYNYAAEAWSERVLKSDDWEEGARKSFVTYTQTIEAGLKIEVMTKDNKVIGVLLTTPYDKDKGILRTGVISHIMFVADSSLNKEDKDQEAYDKLIEDSQIYSSRLPLLPNNDYKAQYNGYIYARSINGAVESDYYLIIHTDYYDEFNTL